MTRQGPFPNIVQVADVALNDSDKTLTVPAGKEWRLQFLRIGLVTTATVGTRNIRVTIKDDGGNTLWQRDFPATQAASLTRTYLLAADMPNDAGFDSAGIIRMEQSAFVLPAAYAIQVLDFNAVDAAADDMTLRLLVEEMTD